MLPLIVRGAVMLWRYKGAIANTAGLAWTAYEAYSALTSGSGDPAEEGEPSRSSSTFDKLALLLGARENKPILDLSMKEKIINEAAIELLRMVSFRDAIPTFRLCISRMDRTAVSYSKNKKPLPFQSRNWFDSNFGNYRERWLQAIISSIPNIRFWVGPVNCGKSTSLSFDLRSNDYFIWACARAILGGSSFKIETPEHADGFYYVQRLSTSLTFCHLFHEWQKEVFDTGFGILLNPIALTALESLPKHLAIERTGLVFPHTAADYRIGNSRSPGVVMDDVYVEDAIRRIENLVNLGVPIVRTYKASDKL
jgi:hypothetical protein